MSEWLRLKDLAAEVKEPYSTLLKMCNANEMAHSRKGRIIRARIRDYNAAIEAGLRGGDNLPPYFNFILGSRSAFSRILFDISCPTDYTTEGKMNTALRCGNIQDHDEHWRCP